MPLWPPTISDHEKSCTNCKWFQFSDKRKDRFGNPIKSWNRECCYEGAIIVKGDVCQMWEDTRTLKEKLQGKRVKKGFC